MKIDKHMLKGSNIDFQECSKDSGEFTDKIRFIVIHYTAGSSRQSSVDHFIQSETKASAHVILGKDGKITQLIPFNKIAWHAGKSEYQGYSSLNSCSIGIEIDNVGTLEKREDSFYSWFGKKVENYNVVRADNKYWEAYDEWQLNTAFDLCELLFKTYDSIIDVVGHRDISPGRKPDPGPHFPIDKFRDLILGNRSNTDNRIKEYLEPMTTVNFRQRPTVKSELLRVPLEPGEKVQVIARAGDWVKVQSKINGWVNAKYLKKV